MSLGPGSQSKLFVRANLSNFILEQSKYVFNLNLWDKFIIWRYTLGSGSLNAFLIGITTNFSINREERTNYWTFLTFKYFNYPLNIITTDFKKYTEYFKNPDKFNLLDKEAKLHLSLNLIQSYVTALQNIINNAPSVREPFTVYKTSGDYPGLPDKNHFKPTKVLQLPFNSTTYDPQFNFAPFTSPDADCCMFEIVISKGIKVLYIPSEIHAYPHEREILLPMNITLDIIYSGKVELDYISLNDSKFIETQKHPLHIGEVYRVDPLAKPIVKRKKMNLYGATI